MKKLLVLALVLAFVASVQAESIWIADWAGVVRNYSTTGTLNTSFQGAQTQMTGMALSQDPYSGHAGNLLIGNWSNTEKVEEYTQTGTYLGISPEFTATSYYGSDVAVDPLGRVWSVGANAPSQVISYKNYTTGGTYSPMSGYYLLGVAFDSSVNAYVSNLSGTIYKMEYVGGAGDGYNDPTVFAQITGGSSWGIKVHNNQVFVSDATSDSIKIFDMAGVLQGSLAIGGNYDPRGMDFDSAGNLYVATNRTQQGIMKFSWNGSSFGTGTFIVTGLNQPTDLVIVPEPATLILLGLGALSLIRRKK